MSDGLLTSFVGYFGAGGVLLAFALLAGKGLLSWRAERNTQTPNELQNAQLRAFQTIAEQANRRADAFAAERNELLVRVTKFESELERLKGVVELNERLEMSLQRKDVEMRELLTEHNQTMNKMLDVVQGLRDHLSRELPTCRFTVPAN